MVNMKHPALAGTMAVILAILCLIMFLAGYFGRGSAEEDYAEALRGYDKLLGYIDTYSVLSEKLADVTAYSEANTDYEQRRGEHDSAASQHRTDVAEHTATQGGYQMGADAIWEQKAQLAELTAGYDAVKAMLKAAEAELAQMEQSIPGIKAQAAQCAAAAQDAAARVPPVEPTAPQEPTPPVEPVVPQEPTAPAAPAEPVSPDVPQPPAEPVPPLRERFPEGEEGESAYQEALSDYNQAVVIYPGLLEQYEAELAAYPGLLEQYEAELAAYPGLLEQYNTELAAYEQELAEYESAREAYERELAEYESIREAYERELAEYESACEAYERELAEYETAAADYALAQAEWAAAADSGRAALAQRGISAPEGNDAAALSAISAALGEEAEKLRQEVAVKNEVMAATDAVVEKLDSLLGLVDGTVQGSLELIWYKMGQLEEEAEKLTEEKEELREQSERLRSEYVRLEQLKADENKLNSTRLILLGYDDIKNGNEQGQPLLDAAVGYSGEYKQRIEEEHRGRLLRSMLALCGGLAGILCIPAGFGKFKSRFLQALPALSCFICAAGGELISRRLELGSFYAAIPVLIFAPLFLLSALPRIKIKNIK